MAFLAPWLLGGLLFASAPLIIHLLNRRQFKLIEWAPMEYLKLTLRTNRRRLQLEQWILLLLRTLLILLLIFAIARPLLNASAAASWLAIGGRTSRVLIIDDSLSMGLHQNGNSAFDRAKEEAASAIETLGTQDSLTVVTTSRMGEPLHQDAPLTAAQAQGLAQEVRDLPPSDTANNWSATLAQAVELLEGASHTNKEIRIITDQRAEGWSNDASEQAQRLEEMGVKITIVNVGTPSPGNAALTKLEQTQGVALVDRSVVFTATIRADGDPQWPTSQATLIIDGNENPYELPEIAPNQEVEVEIEWSFRTPGQHTIELRLPDDAMPGDNRQVQVVNVTNALNVLLIDGEYSINRFESELDYVKTALALQSRQIKEVPFEAMHISDTTWLNMSEEECLKVPSPIGGQDLGNYNLVILANVGVLPPHRVALLREMVASGPGLMIFMGDQVDPDAYNVDLFANGEGIMPGLIDETAPIEAEGIAFDPIDDTPFARVRGLSPRLHREVVPLRTTRVTLDEEDDGVRVLMRWNNTDLPPAVIEKRIGLGRVLLWTTTADRAWSDWPIQTSFIIGVRDAALDIVGTGELPGNLTAGDPIRQPVPNNPAPSSAKIQHPGEESTNPAEIDRQDPDSLLVRYANTQGAGVYRLTWDKLGSENQQRFFAVSPDARESNLERMTESQLGQLLKGPKIEFVDRAGDGPEPKELWRTLAVLLLAMVVIESCFATWVGREH